MPQRLSPVRLFIGGYILHASIQKAVFFHNVLFNILQTLFIVFNGKNLFFRSCRNAGLS